VLNAAAPDDQIRSGCAFVVLVVEDDVLARYALCDAFRYDGFTVLEASSFDEAKALLSSSVALDLVFIDLNIPGEGNGLTIAEFAKEHRPAVKVIFTSGRAPARLRPQLESFGPFVPKPFIISRVIRLIRRTLASEPE
jgi:DNA-binding NtrC family response regulator